MINCNLAIDAIRGILQFSTACCTVILSDCLHIISISKEVMGPKSFNIQQSLNVLYLHFSLHFTCIFVSRHFENLAVGVLSECYTSDEKKARLILVRESRSYGQATNVILGVEADNKKFIAHPACQSLLNNVWMGRMHVETGVVTVSVLWGKIQSNYSKDYLHIKTTCL